MPPARKILIADPDAEASRTLAKALRTRGYQVYYAADGTRALEVAVLRHPELILFDEACMFLEAQVFIQILRTNPRTEAVPVVLTTRAAEPDKLRGLRDGFFVKPYHVDEVISRIDHLFRRSQAARELKGDSKEIEGTLTQLSIADLLQVLAMNKRSGRIVISRDKDRGEIHVGDGRPLNAKLGAVEGDKALFRLLGWLEGSFSFFPGAPTARVRIDRSMDDALLQGMREVDEVARLLASLPPRSARVRLAPDAALTKDQHPVTSQVVDLLRQPRPVGELLDLSPASDLETLRVLTTLLQKSVARVAPDAVEADRGPLLEPAEAHALRARVSRGGALHRPVVLKVFVLGSGAAAARRVLASVPGLVPVAANPTAIHSGFGCLGGLEVAESLRVDFCLLPPGEAARPIWRPFSCGAIGALILDGSDAVVKLGTYLGWEIRVPLVSVGQEVPAALQGAPAGATAVKGDVVEALQTLLSQASQAPAA